MLTDDQFALLVDKYVLWERASREGPMDLRDYNCRAAAAPVIVSDWLADTAHLCRELTARSLYWSDPKGDLRGMPPLRFECSNVDAYPTTLPDAVQHNAWWDAMALREKLAPRPSDQGER